MLNGIPVTFADGDIIFAQGAGAADLFVIRSGTVRIVRSSNDGDEVLAELGPGDFFGEMAIFKPGPRSASAVAVGPVEVDAIDRPSFLSAMDDPYVQEMLAEMARRLRATGVDEL